MHRVRHLLQPALPASNAARATALALLAASLLGAGVALQDQGKEAAPKAEATRVKILDGERKLDLQMNGEVQLDPTAKEPVAVPGDGSFRVEEKRGGKARAYSASRDKRTYTVDGKEQPLDAEGEAWLREAVKDAAKARTARDRAHRIEIHTRHLEAQTRGLEAQAKALEAQTRALEAQPGLSPEERARIQADMDQARTELQKARAERRRVRLEVIRKKGEAGKDLEILTEDAEPGTVLIRKKVDGKEVIEKRVKLRGAKKGEGGTWTFTGPGEEGMVVEVPGDITIPPIHIPEIHLGHPGAEADPQAEIRALQSAMKAMQKRLDQLQKQAAAPKPPRAPKAPEPAPLPPPPPPAPDAPPAPPAPPAEPGV